jgi:hypothetical protein
MRLRGGLLLLCDSAVSNKTIYPKAGRKWVSGHVHACFFFHCFEGEAESLPFIKASA